MNKSKGKKEIKINEEALKALFEGKKLIYDHPDLHLTLYPPRYGVFMTHEKFTELERKVYARAYDEISDILKKILQDDSLTP